MRVMGTADKKTIALTGGDAGAGDADGVGSGGFLAHEGAGRADYAMHQRDIAGQQIRQLCQEQRGAEIAEQMLVQVSVGIGAFGYARHDGLIGGVIALPPAGRHDHVHPAQQLGVAFDAGMIQRGAGGVGAVALPWLHLPLLALGYLSIQRDRRHRVDGKAGEAGRIHNRGKGVQGVPMGVHAFAET